jgi:hypothetical protein
MKLFIIVKALAVTALLSGCNQANVKDILTNLDKDCVRHYAGSLASGVPASGTVTFTIDCKPSGTPLTPAPTTP